MRPCISSSSNPPSRLCHLIPHGVRDSWEERAIDTSVSIKGLENGSNTVAEHRDENWNNLSNQDWGGRVNLESKRELVRESSSSVRSQLTEKQKQVECPVGKSLQAKLCATARKYRRSSEKSNEAKRFEARSQNRH